MSDSKDVKDPKGEPPGYVEAQLQSVLTDARQLYSQSSGKHENVEEFMDPNIRSIEELKARIDASNDNFANFRAKRAGLFGSLSAMLKPVELVGEIATGATAEVFPATQSIFSAVMFLVNAANNVSTTYDSIQELFDQLRDFTSRLNVYLQHNMSPALREKIVEIFSALFEVIVIATKQVRRGRVKSYFRNLFGADSPVAEAMEKLQRLTLGEERQVLADTYGGVSQINTKADQLNTKSDRVESLVRQVNENVEELRSEYKERTSVAHQDKLREILEPSPFPEDFYTSFVKARVSGTGEWLLDDTGLQAWRDGDTKYLWLSGGPGVGKSFLATRLITWANEKLNHSAYFYFRANNPETRSVLQALRDVAYQLSESDAFYGKQIVKNVHSAEDIKTIPSVFRKLFVEPFEDDPRGRSLHVFLDGIDEAETGEIETLLSQMAPNEDVTRDAEGKSKVRFALVGRSYMSDIVSSYLDPPNTGQSLTTVHVTPDRNAKDVRAYIEDGVNNSRILSRSGVELRKQVIETMDKRVDGLFILAKFMLADVNRRRRPNSVLKSLESFPKEINGVLNTTLVNLSSTITEEEAEDLNEMLRWTACAEQALTIEQLEAALILAFGDPPFRFEDSLRGQYACFFELEREDGLTTDDLVKNHEREQRTRRTSTPTGSRPRRSSSVGKKDSPQRPSISPSQRLTESKRRRTSPVALETSPIRNYSPSRSPALSDPERELEFRSKKSTTAVTFFHASVREYFRDEDTTAATASSGGHKIGFDITEAKVHVLSRCLKIFNDDGWFKREQLGSRRFALKQYAAWYWQEHLAALDIGQVKKDDKQTIGRYLAGMLMEEDIIYDWSIMYEKNDEGLEVLTDRNIKALTKWMSDPDVLAGLNDTKRTWATEAVKHPMGIFQNIGKFYARAWVDESFEKYIPTKFCFKIVQAMAFMDAGYKWSDSQCHWSDISIAKRIEKATAWAGFDKTAHWYRRVGSTYLTNGMHEIALDQYNEALKLDAGSIETNGRKAYCLSKDKQYEQALRLALKCETTERNMINEGNLPIPKLAASRWRLYKDQYLIAQCYYRLSEVDKSIEYFHLAIISADHAKLDYHERFEPVIGFLEVLAAENKHPEMMRLIQDLSLQASGPSQELSRIVDFLLGEHKASMVMDWIPKAACKSGQAEFLIERLEMAIEVALNKRDALKELYLRLALGTTHVFNRDFEWAIEVFEQISLVEYRPRGNVPTRQAHAISFQKLASLYKDMVLKAGATNTTADGWIKKLEDVQAKQNTHQNLDLPASMLGSDVNAAAIYLALFYRLRGRTREAEDLLSSLIVESCEILEDEDLKNDEFALENLLRLFIAADDEKNAKALATSMRRINPEASISTPGDSPVQQRAYVEPKLPDIQTSNRSCAQCLEIISPNIEFFMCRYCLNSYCRRCLDKTIKPGKEDSICRKDHKWFSVPPLARNLHTGQLLVEGDVVGFGVWKDGIRQRWEKR